MTGSYVTQHRSPRARVELPALLLQIWGGVFIAVASLLFIMMCLAPIAERRDVLEAMVLSGIMGSLYAVTGSFLIYSGHCLRQLRSYGVVFAGILFGIITGIVLCMPLTPLGIWPLITICDPEIKRAFELS